MPLTRASFPVPEAPCFFLARGFCFPPHFSPPATGTGTGCGNHAPAVSARTRHPAAYVTGAAHPDTKKSPGSWWRGPRSP